MQLNWTKAQRQNSRGQLNGLAFTIQFYHDPVD
jgi:hypothetical protein